MWGEVLAHDVFICYATKDKAVADAICASLESRKIACWIAPRNVLEGALFAEQIVDAIIDCKVFVLLYSANSNASPHVMREVSEAGRVSKPFIPFRIQDVPPSKALNYYIGPVQWLDALEAPLDRPLEKLAERVECYIRESKECPAPDNYDTELELKSETTVAPAPLPVRQKDVAIKPSDGQPTKILGNRIIKKMLIPGAVLAILVCVIMLVLASGWLLKHPDSSYDPGWGLQNNASGSIMNGTSQTNTSENVTVPDNATVANNTGQTDARQPTAAPGSYMNPTIAPTGVTGASSHPTSQPLTSPTPTPAPSSGSDGTLRLTLNVQATLYVDDNMIDIGPTLPGTTDYSLRPGSHKIGFIRAGYGYEIYGTVSIISGQVTPLNANLIITPTPAPDGTLRLTLNVQAMLYVDDNSIDTGPMSPGTRDINLRPGNHKISFYRAGYLWDVYYVDIASSQLATLNANLPV